MINAGKFLLSTCLGALLLAPAFAADLSSEWPTYGHDAGDMRYSPLTQVTPGNVGKLDKVWTFHMRPASLDVAAANPAPAAAAPRRPGRRALSKFVGSEATPLVVNGRMFIATPYRRVVALNAETGNQIWAYDVPGNDAPATRGVEYWPGGAGAKPRIIIPTRNGALISVDAATGELVPGFGKGGILDVKTPDVLNGYPNAAYGFSSPPLVLGNVLITGSRVQENPTKGAAGDVRGWDVRTGKQLWTFHSVPRPGELGHDTWEGDSWQGRSGVNIWTVLVGDAKRNIVYLPFGAPTFDRWGGDRHGTNLFSDAIVALDARTGKYLWHFQTVHHDIWDVDLPSATLIEVKRGGKTIPGIAVMNKTSILFMLDRVTGKPLYDTKEVPVPTNSDIPDEQPWPTQPMSVTPPLARVQYDPSELVSAAVSPELHAYCEKLAKDKNVTASKLFSPMRTDSSVAAFPSSLGGIDWGGAAFDPKRGLYITNSNNLAALAQMAKRGDTWTMKDGYAYFWNPETREPCQQPPWGNLNAVDVNTGKIAWQVPLGISEDLPAGQQNKHTTDLPMYGGILATASNLVFAGEMNGYFDAFDARTGKQLWKYFLGVGVCTPPITYRVKGVQYIAVGASGCARGREYLNRTSLPQYGDTLAIFSLPG